MAGAPRMARAPSTAGASAAAAALLTAGALLAEVEGVEPLRATDENSPAASIAPTVVARRRRGVSQPKRWLASQLRKPVAAEAAHIAQPTHMTAA
jgi:hypothetical protein